MKKKIVYLILIICFCFVLTACRKPKAIILFNKYPITKENLLNNATEFKVDKRIYYILMIEKPLDSEFVRVRVFKRDKKADFRLTKMVYSDDVKLRKEGLYYYTDYLVMHEAGNYYMMIYALNALDRPLAMADFKVDD